jgi:cytochrome P450
MLSMNVITRMVLGKRLFDADGGGENAAAEGPVSSLAEFMWMMDELMLLNGVLNIGDWIPWLDWLDLQGYVRRMKRIAERFDAFLEHVLDAHSQSQRRRRGRDGESFLARDMVDVLMQLADDPTFEVQIGRVGVKAFTQDLIVGGTEPVSATVEWAMSELLRKPSVFAMAAEELDRVVGRGRWVTEKDVAHLPYLQAVIKETMRVHPIAPLLPRTLPGRTRPSAATTFPRAHTSLSTCGLSAGTRPCGTRRRSSGRRGSSGARLT